LFWVSIKLSVRMRLSEGMSCKNAKESTSAAHCEVSSRFHRKLQAKLTKKSEQAK